MKSPRPPAKSRLPRAGCPAAAASPSGGCVQPSGARQSAKAARRPGWALPVDRLQFHARRLRFGKLAASSSVNAWRGLLPGFCSSPLAALLIVAAVGDLRSRGPSPTGSTSPIALLAIPFWWASGLALWPDVALQLGVAALVFALVRRRLRARRDGRRRRQAGRARSRCGCRSAAVAEAARDHVARRRRADAGDGGPPAARAKRGTRSRFPTASPSPSPDCG